MFDKPASINQVHRHIKNRGFRVGIDVQRTKPEWRSKDNFPSSAWTYPAWTCMGVAINFDTLAFHVAMPSLSILVQRFFGNDGCMYRIYDTNLFVPDS
jgi:hypothetical protein